MLKEEKPIRLILLLETHLFRQSQCRSAAKTNLRHGTYQMNKSWFEPRMQIRYCHATTAKFFPVNAIKRQTMEKKNGAKTLAINDFLHI